MQSASEPMPGSLLFQQDIVRQGSPSRSPRRIHTVPSEGEKQKMFKRIIVFCDGTWQDGVSKQRSQYTNVLRLARTVNREDDRLDPPIPQVVFYQSGIGSENNFYSEYIEGTTGGSLADKVEDAYAFIAHNYHPGDEIFLFGFSRGAYTARMVSMFIGEIGVLNRTDMDSFASIFIDFQALGKSQDPMEKKELEEKLAPWRRPDSKGKRRADIDNDKFTVKCVGVWDTVGSVGLPEELSLSKKTYHMFGFPDRILGEHVQHAFQALALNEMRADFNCNRFMQTEAGRLKGQTLRQCWFTGCHSDIGGGYKSHDLADLTLTWMAAQVEVFLSLDIHYLQKLFQPVAPWGTQQPHDSATGIFRFADTIQRTLPISPNDPETHESFHSSILEQEKLDPSLRVRLNQCPELVADLAPLEVLMKTNWPYDPNSFHAQHYASKLKAQADIGSPNNVKTTSWIRTLLRTVSGTATSVNTTTTTQETVVVEKRERRRTLVGIFDVSTSSSQNTLRPPRN
ncbi:hypothetical protein GALMADRAFT_301820 [Galerina marginata CBS 339.88]|uniref:T6SS Phospholipase effector Tle1-like catalytic domain-containing protein n=1 Tax=Galerina marginata (strain CBS 339.88) TaxID=685588 RepID=A0A067U0U9_GALM3|nr:hypothetical protein GALMADRAFT_301820 [Galerina marginata CBS 339.88]